jgi:hypothetical protein
VDRWPLVTEKPGSNVMRKILLHYHLFKNAGSSIDRCLKASFGDRWHAFDPESPSGVYTASELREIIDENDRAVAFSSHCIVPPLLVGSTQVSPIIILREPISRVFSAYTFEWQKQKGLDAPVGELDEYIHAKFEMPRRNAIENFQTMRLSVTDDSKRAPASDKSDVELVEAACRVIDKLPAFGLVERFDESVNWLQQSYCKDFPGLDLQPVAANVTQSASKPLWVRNKAIADRIGDELYNELLLRNQMDIQLYAYAAGRFNAMVR